MRVCFLDIDGVINLESVKLPDEVKVGEWNGPGKGGFLSRDLVGVLDEFVKDTGCKIVCSSVWRSDGPGAIDRYLKEAGAKHTEVIDCTPHLGEWCIRGNEIRAWLQMDGRVSESSNDYVIFDDSSDMLYWQRHHFFQTDPFVGLTKNITFKAKSFLEGKVW